MPTRLSNVVEGRRAVRVYDATPIPEEVMRECLRLALLAPEFLQPANLGVLSGCVLPIRKRSLVEVLFGPACCENRAGAGGGGGSAGSLARNECLDVGQI